MPEVEVVTKERLVTNETETAARTVPRPVLTGEVGREALSVAVRDAWQKPELQDVRRQLAHAGEVVAPAYSRVMREVAPRLSEAARLAGLGSLYEAAWGRPRAAPQV